MATVTSDNLTDVMDFDHVVEVHPDGSVSDADTGIWAPEAWCQNGDYRKPVLSSQPGREWTLLDGYSGQYLYHGPIMHPSEFIGGKMADDILAEPGLYALIEVRDLDADTDNGEDDSVGWAVARLC